MNIVPKSTANARPETVPSWSLTNFPEMPAVNRSEKRCAYVNPTAVSATEYVSPDSPSGSATVYTG